MYVFDFEVHDSLIMPSMSVSYKIIRLICPPSSPVALNVDFSMLFENNRLTLPLKEVCRYNLSRFVAVSVSVDQKPLVNLHTGGF